MITIVEPKKHIADLWGQQRVKQEATFRQMRYVLRVDHEGKVLLHNVVTGQLVVLSPEEAEEIQALPSSYTPVMEELIKAHYLVPEDYDEHQQVVNLRTILRELEDQQESKDIVHYTILPTTICNARCYYCFEQGSTPMTMSCETASNVVKFIENHCSSRKKVKLSWFGGEPTLAVDRITQICQGLHDAGIQYGSQMITNGYLFDKHMVDQAVTDWHLQAVQITIDGTEKTYNRVKSYVGIKDNAYYRVMNNIEMLLQRKVQVTLRMNFDLTNIGDFHDLAGEVSSRFGHDPYLVFAVHPINGEYADSSGQVHHAENDWFGEELVQLYESLKSYGLNQKTQELPYLRSNGCLASSNTAVTIIPNGYIVSCPEQFKKDQYRGNVADGLVNRDNTRSWRAFADYPKCTICSFFPHCVRIAKCLAKDRCQYSNLRYQQFTEAIKKAYNGLQ